MLNIKKLFTKIITKFGAVEVLYTGVRLIRLSNVRILILSECQGANGSLTIPAADIPPAGSNAIGPILRSDSNGRSTCVGYVAVSSSTGSISRYYAGTYNNSGTGLSGVNATDKSSGIVAWVM